MKRNKLVLCLDFDGVIHSYESGWRGPRTIPDLPVPGALEFIVKAMEHFDIHIFSSRSRYFGGRWAMKRWLWDRYAELGGVKKTGWPLPFRQFDVNLTIPEIPKWYWNSILEYTSMEPWEWEVHYGIKRLLKKIKFPTKKPPAFLIIDDRAYTFRGIFPDPRTLLNFKPWNKTHLADPSGADIGVTSEKKLKIEITMSPYDEGYEAFYRGDPPEMNPYDERDAQHDQWNQGYEDADCYESGEFE